MLTGAQIRAGRAMLRWSSEELSARARVPLEAVRLAEEADGHPRLGVAALAAIATAFETGGLAFTRGGVSGAAPRGEGIRLEDLNATNDD